LINLYIWDANRNVYFDDLFSQEYINMLVQYTVLLQK
jgi:hypothetical protein